MPIKDLAGYRRRMRAEGRVKKKIPLPVKFVAVDGEGTEEGGKQVYSLLSSSIHNPIVDRKGLSTERCLRYLLDLNREPRTVVTGFGFNYDVNMILKDLSEEQFEEMYQTESCWYHGEQADYLLRKASGKTFSITEYTSKTAYHEHTKRLRSVTIWDSLGFFQGRFVDALDSWKIPLNEEQTKILTTGKSERGTFVWKNIDQIIQYNDLECDLLVLLMNRLQETLRESGLYLSRWDGAGAIAATMMRKYGVKKYVVQGFPKPIEDAMMRAYFGGRSECVQFGHFKAPTYHYDLNSAYPSSYLDLPNLHGVWRETNQYLPNERYVIYDLAWNLPEGSPIGPFPWRSKDGSIRYPLIGEGCYHSNLVDVAMKIWSQYITIRKAFVFTPDTSEKPFSFIVPLMDQRLQWKREGDMRHVTYKLGLNSIYGKTAQSKGFQGKPPPYQSFYWAGRITAWAQAKLLDASIQNPESIIFFGTDAIFSSNPLDLDIGDTLGTWEDCGIIDRFELYQPGLYRMFWDDKSATRTRGFHGEEVDFDLLASVWEEKRHGGVVTTQVTRFLGLEGCAARGRFDEWRTWKTSKRDIHLRPGTLGSTIEKEKTGYDHHPPLKDTYRIEVVEGIGMSAPFEKRKMILPGSDDGTVALEVFLANAEQMDNLTD